MNSYIKNIFLNIVVLTALTACGDSSEVPVRHEPAGDAVMPSVSSPVTLLDEHFNDNSVYLTPGGMPLPARYTDGFFIRKVDDDDLKVYLTQCLLEPDASVPGDEPVSHGRILIGAGTGAVETDPLGCVTRISVTVANASASDTGVSLDLMIRTAGADWTLYATSPVMTGDDICTWVVDSKIMQYPLSLKIIANGTSGSAVAAIYDLNVEGTVAFDVREPQPVGDALLSESFDRDSEHVRTFNSSDGNEFPDATWDCTDGYFDRMADDLMIRVKLHGCRIDYSHAPISIYGDGTSAGRIAVDGNGGYIELPVLSSITGLSMTISPGSEGQDVTRSLIQYRNRGTSRWKTLVTSPDATASSPIKWVLDDVSLNPVAIRIMQDPAIAGGSLSIHDLVLCGTPEREAEAPVEVTLMQERFRDIATYTLTSTGGEPDRKEFYPRLHFDRVIGGTTLRTNIYNGRIHTTYTPPDNDFGATQGCMMLKEYSEGGAMETPIYGSVKSLEAYLVSGTSKKYSRAVLQKKGLDDEDWIDVAVSDVADHGSVTMWKVDDISEIPVALRIVQHSDYHDNLGVFNITIIGTLY